jgi:sulfur carrier protein
MELRVNGDAREMPEGTTVADLVERLLGTRKGCAVAVGGQVVARRDWDQRALADGDAVEVLVAAQGG